VRRHKTPDRGETNGKILQLFEIFPNPIPPITTIATFIHTMGFKVTTLHNVPVDNLEYFIYVLEPSYSHEYKIWFDANFDSVGKELGRNAAIVRGYDDRLTQELWQLFQKYTSDPEQRESLEQALLRLVTLIISKGDILTTKEPIYAIPINVIDSDPNVRNQFMNILMGRILDAVRGDSVAELVEQLGFHTVPLLDDRAGMFFSTLRYLNNVLELKPNVAGIGMNINKILDRFLAPRRELPDA
jgi:hypothetical protein